MRTATGLTTKLSISDMTGYISGLYPINLLDNPSEDTQTYPTENGGWGHTYWTATLSKGVYSFSVYVLSNTQSTVTGRCEFGTGKAVDLLSNSSMPWGFPGDNNIDPQSSGLITLAFKVTQEGTFHFGFSGYPFSGGELTARQPMLNAGSMPLPFTMNKLVVGSSTQPASSASQSTQSAASPATR
ncbi:hypothetical protein FOL88_06050 [Lactobacillus reuteri]|uniref:hypothetical protein n=1 Tax=Limosilactobacillus reuteri TaxID=1598 RepID=UPI00146C6D11|nr:hypothetical protein [Limosilactobacillus reuteri]NMV54475.1 hypothetical protein [Limosilactobacillus reuteri]